MTQLDFINDFVLKYPRLYVRLISYNLPFSEENLDKYGFLLSWDKLGIPGNSFIKWTPFLKSRFSEKLSGKLYAPQNQEYLKLAKNPHLPENYIHDIRTKSFQKGKGFCQSLKFSELSIDIIRQYKDYILDWNAISFHFKEVTYDFIIEFKDKISLTGILLNPSVNWEDTRLYSLYVDNYEILLCKNVWEQFVSKYANNQTIQRHLEAFNGLNKQLKVMWKAPEKKKDNVIKYFLSVYVNCSYGHQLMAAGYFYTEKNIDVGRIVDVGSEQRYPIREDCKFH